jgi:hypothetical protein
MEGMKRRIKNRNQKGLLNFLQNGSFLKKIIMPISFRGLNEIMVINPSGKITTINLAKEYCLATQSPNGLSAKVE